MLPHTLFILTLATSADGHLR